MDFNKPLSRKEAILQNILGAQNVLIDYQSEIEAILQAILNDTPYTEEGRSRIARLLIAIKNNGTWDELPTLSRNEEILYCILNGEEYTKKPQSRIEELLIEWLHASPKGYEKTVTGNPIVISDALAEPAISLKAKLNPIQDLHGYDSPWVGGSGKNKFNPDILMDGYITVSGYIAQPQGDKAEKTSDYIPITSGTAYIFSLNVANTEDKWIGIGLYDANKDFIKRTTNDLLGPNENVSLAVSATYTEGASYARISYRSYNIATNMQFEEGTSATSYEPYSNICPISGYTEANVNVSPLNIAQLYNGQIYDNGDWVSTSWRLTNASKTQDNLYFLKAGTYTLDYDKLNSSAPDLLQCSVLTKDDNYTIIDNFATEWHDLPFTFTLTQDGYLYFTARKDSNTALNIDDYKAKILGQTHNIQFRDGDNPLTVYGGSLDVTSGELVVDRTKWILEPDASQIESVKISDCLIYIPRDKFPNSWNVNINKCMCNKLKASNYSMQHDNHVHFPNTTLIALYLIDEVGTTKQDWVDYLAQSQIEVSYILATPIIYQLTPNEVQLLLGDNTIWSDMDDLELTYNGSNPALQLSTLLKKNSNNKQ